MDFARQAIVEATAACNMACPGCARTYTARDLRTMSLGMWLRIVAELGRDFPDCELWPAFMGEPTLLQKPPDGDLQTIAAGDLERPATSLAALVLLAKQRGVRRVTVNTNGTRLVRIARDLIEVGTDRVIVSIDATTDATYLKVRPATRQGFSLLSAAVAGALAVTEAARGSRTLVEVQMVCFDENEAEADAFIRRWTEAGAIVKVRARSTFAAGVPGATPGLRLPTVQRQPCRWAWDTIAVTWDGRVVTCACDGDAVGLHGDLSISSLKTIWQTSLAALRKLHEEKRWQELPKPCRDCGDWQVKGDARTYFPDDQARDAYMDYIRARGPLSGPPEQDEAAREALGLTGGHA